MLLLDTSAFGGTRRGVTRPVASTVCAGPMGTPTRHAEQRTHACVPTERGAVPRPLPRCLSEEGSRCRANPPRSPRSRFPSGEEGPSLVGEDSALLGEPGEQAGICHARSGAGFYLLSVLPSADNTSLAQGAAAAERTERRCCHQPLVCGQKTQLPFGYGRLWSCFCK